MLNKQKIFTKVKNHLLKQKEKAFNPNKGTCRYKFIKDGKILKCAIGCLISEKNYHSCIENKSLGFINHPTYKKHPGYRKLRKILELELKTKLNENDIEFLNELQQIHDGLSEWKSSLKYFAEKHKLKYDSK